MTHFKSEFDTFRFFDYISNIEISQSLGITTDAVKKAKQRLKKKLGGHQDLLLLFTQKETTKTNT